MMLHPVLLNHGDTLAGVVAGIGLSATLLTHAVPGTESLPVVLQFLLPLIASALPVLIKRFLFANGAGDRVRAAQRRKKALELRATAVLRRQNGFIPEADAIDSKADTLEKEADELEARAAEREAAAGGQLR